MKTDSLEIRREVSE